MRPGPLPAGIGAPQPAETGGPRPSESWARRARRLVVALAAIPMAGVLLVAQPLPGSAVAHPLCAAAATVHHAALVLEHGDGATVTVCVPFTADSVTGEGLLAAAGIERDEQTFGAMGRAVCQLDHEPAQPPADCFGTSSYWELFASRGGGAWTPSPQGVSTVTIRDGDGLGLHYASQADPPSPPRRPAAGVCAAATPAPAASQPPGPGGHGGPAPVPAVPATTAAGQGRPTTAAGGSPTAAPAPSGSASPGPATGEASPTSSASATAPVRGSARAVAARPQRGGEASPGGWLLAAASAVALCGLAAVAARRRRA